MSDLPMTERSSAVSFVASRKGRSWLAVAVLVAGLALSNWPHEAGAAVKEIAIEQNTFSPAALTVTAGDTVQWTNKDTAPHTVTISSGPAKFSSPTLQKGDTFTFTFEKPGTYSYFCAVHPDMKAAVTVLPAAATVATEPPPAGGAMPAPSPSPHMTPGHPAPAPPTSPAPAPAPAPPGEAPSAPGAARCGGDAVAGVLEPFVAHLKKAHLEESPGQQAADLLDVDQYVKTHTVLVGDMVAPTTSSATGSSGC